MAHTAATFKARWAEFSALDDATVTAALAEATRRTDARVFGASFDDAVALLAADQLSVGAFGQQARKDAKSESDAGSTYMVALKQLRRERAGGAWSCGQGPGGLLT